MASDRIADRLFLDPRDRAQVKRVFARWDAAGSGHIPAPDFKRMLAALDPSLSEDVLEAVLADADTNSDSLVDYNEFWEWVFKSPPPCGLEFQEMQEKPPAVTEFASLPVISPSCSALDIDHFCVTIFTMNGQPRLISGLQECMLLSELLIRVRHSLDVSEVHRAALLSGGTPYSEYDAMETLGALGITNGSELVCVLQKGMFNIALEMEIEVSGAGAASVNGKYTAKKETYFGWGTQHCFEHQNQFSPYISTHTIRWYAENDGWPAGWYIETHKKFTLYYQPTYAQTYLPFDGWRVYNGPMMSAEAMEPPPLVRPLQECQ